MVFTGILTYMNLSNFLLDVYGWQLTFCHDSLLVHKAQGVIYEHIIIVLWWGRGCPSLQMWQNNIIENAMSTSHSIQYILIYRQLRVDT